MADLIVEDGSLATSTANSYVSLDDFEVYWENRWGLGDTWYGYTDAQKEEALVRAGEYLNSLKWKGTKLYYNQGMSWPREGVYDEDDLLIPYTIIPAQIKNAQMEGAKVELASNGALQSDLDRGGKVKRKKVDVLETEWFDGAPAGTVYRRLSGYLSGLTISSSVVRIMRA